MRRNVLVLTGVLCVLLGAPVWAGTTGNLSGTVVDDQNQPLPGVTITIQSPALIGGARMAVTDANGGFSFAAIAPGMYTVKAELAGFVTQERSEVQVRLDRTTELNIQMPMSKFGEEITVVAETPVVDPSQVSTAQNFTADYLKYAAIGSANRSYQNVLTQAAGVVGGGNPNVFGSTMGENAYYVDGLDTTDPVTATFGTNFNFDAIQEISLQTGGFEAEYGRATGGVVNLITKSGGNTFSGTFDIRYRTDSFYSSGDYFDAEEQEVKFVDPSATLGGPILRDKVWFFASYEDITSDLTPYLSPTTRSYQGQNYIGKVTWQVNPNWRVVGKISGDPADIDNANASQYASPETTRFQTQGGKIYQGEVSGILSPALLFGFQTGFYRSYLDSYPQTGDLDTVAHYNDDTGLWSGNYVNAQYSDRDRDEYKANLTYFVDQLLGSHEFKGGVEYSDMSFWSHNFTTGGGYYYEDIAVDPPNDMTPIPFAMWESPDSGAQDYTGTLQTAYLQDAWKLLPNLTIKLGVRWDGVKYNTNDGSEVGKMDKVQPRVGLAWDITGDAKNVAKFSWGRFMHPNALTLPSFARTTTQPTSAWLSCSTFFGDMAACQAYVAARASRGYRWQAGPDNWDPAGWWLNPRNVFSSEPNQIDPDIRATYADELIVGFERELFTRTSVEVTFVDKETKDILEDTCNGNVPTPAEDSACDYYIMTNIPGLKRDYKAGILKFETRAKSWLHILASYTYAKSRGNVEYTQNAGTDFDIYPYHFTNTYGYLSDDRRHRVKLNGYVLLPYQFIVGLEAFWSSAFAWAPYRDLASPLYGTEFLEPRGSRRGEDNYQLDLQVSKGLQVGPANLQLILAVQNVLSTENVTGLCEREGGCGDYDLGEADSWQTPRRYEFGFRVEF